MPSRTLVNELRNAHGSPAGPRAPGWTETDEPAANTQAVASHSATAGRRHVIRGVFVVANTAASTARVVVGSTTVVPDFPVGADAFEQLRFDGIEASVNEAVSVEVDANGVGNTVAAYIEGYTLED